MRKTLRTTGDRFISEKNAFATFMKDPEDWPRLSILENYRQIKTIMTKSYMKGLEFEQKYRNRDQKDCMRDKEYVKFKKEEENTMKMATILKNLSSPKKKRIEALRNGGKQLDEESQMNADVYNDL